KRRPYSSGKASRLCRAAARRQAANTVWNAYCGPSASDDPAAGKQVGYVGLPLVGRPDRPSYCTSGDIAAPSRRVEASWDILKTLSDPTRLRLLALVSREE